MRSWILLLALSAATAFAGDDNQMKGNAGAIAPLLQKVMTGTEDERQAAKEKLLAMNPGGSALGLPAVTATVLAALKHPDAEVREITCRFLQNKRVDHAELFQQVLLLYRKDPSVEVRAAALAAANGPISATMAADTFERLRAALSKEPLIAAEAADLILRQVYRSTTPTEVARTLLNELQSESSTARQVAAEAIILRAEAQKNYELLLEAATVAKPGEAEMILGALAQMTPKGPKVMHKLLEKMRQGSAAEQKAAQVADARLAELAGGAAVSKPPCDDTSKLKKRKRP